LAGRTIELLGNAPADDRALLWRRAHQGHGLVVLVDVALPELRRHGLDGAEVHHVERADGHDLRNALPPRRRQAIGPCGEHAADHFVTPLGRGHIDDARNIAVGNQPLHRPPARAGRVKDQHVEPRRLELLTHHGHARRRHAEHRRRKERPIGVRLVRLERSGSDHAGNRSGRVRENASRQRVQPRDVDDGIHHREVFDVDIGRRLP
jgi:hypothetical protein